jgi:hypothetical protein
VHLASFCGNSLLYSILFHSILFFYFRLLSGLVSSFLVLLCVVLFCHVLSCRDATNPSFTLFFSPSYKYIHSRCRNTKQTPEEIPETIPEKHGTLGKIVFDKGTKKPSSRKNNTKLTLNNKCLNVDPRYDSENINPQQAKKVSVAKKSNGLSLQPQKKFLSEQTSAH